MAEREEAKSAKRGRKAPEGDRRSFFATMSSDVIKAIKNAAIADETTASVILEEAAKEWLERRGRKLGG
jgi:hypothetical protein